MPIRIEVVANNATELQSLLVALAPMLPSCAVGGVVTSEDGRAAAIIEPMDMGGDLDPNAETDEPEAEEAPATTPAPKTRGRKPKKEAEAETPDPKADVADPKKAKAEAIALLIQIWARGKAGPAAIKKVQEEYGVANFKDVPDDRAIELLATAKKLDAEIKVPG